MDLVCKIMINCHFTLFVWAFQFIVRLDRKNKILNFLFFRHFFKSTHKKIYNSRTIMTLSEENNAAQNSEENEVQVVNIETVEAKDNKGIDYDKLIGKLNSMQISITFYYLLLLFLIIIQTQFLEQFGSQPVSTEQKEKIGKLSSSKVHRFLRRGIFFSQR